MVTTTNNLDEGSPSHLRIIDANLNRLREGLRVVEDIFRYVFENKNLSYKIKELRHTSRISLYEELLDSRDAQNDCLKGSTIQEQTREKLSDILIASFKRAQESSRVLEEICKLFSNSESEKFKQIRYELYELEKEILNLKTIQ